MFLHPSTLLFTVCLMTTILMIISSESWLILWILLEMNLLVFIPIIFNKKSKYQSEAALKYFINQAIASILILATSTLFFYDKFFTSNVIFVAFMLKMGVAPLHGWLVSVASTISWTSLWLILVLQKIGPLLVMTLFLDKVMTPLALLFIFFTSGVGALGGISSPFMKKIMLYSSISQMGWILVSLSLNKYTWSLYYFVYSFIMTALLFSMSNLNINKINDLINQKNSYTKIIMMFNMLSIAGLPPLSGFMMKLSIIILTMNSPKLFILFPLIISSLISLFFYSRIFYMNSMINISKKTIKHHSSNNSMIILMNMFSLPLGFIMIIYKF